MSMVRGPQRSVRTRFMPLSISRQSCSSAGAVNPGLDQSAADEKVRLIRLAPWRGTVEVGNGKQMAIGMRIEFAQCSRHRGGWIADIAAKTQCGHRHRLKARCSTLTCA